EDGQYKYSDKRIPSHLKKTLFSAVILTLANALIVCLVFFYLKTWLIKVFLLHGKHSKDVNITLFFSAQLPLVFLGVIKIMTYQLYTALENSSNIHRHNVLEFTLAIIAIFVSVKAVNSYGIMAALAVDAFYRSFLSSI
ncbi:MAG: hypothetical protein MHPSP_001736, partial [Paramarteilia canceri]